MNQSNDLFSARLAQSHAALVKVVVLGIPFDGNASYLHGPRFAPAQIRAVLDSGASNWASEGGLELDQLDSWIDLGDLPLQDGEDPYSQISTVVSEILARSVKVFSLGGDHSITYPVMRAYGEQYPKISLLQIDAHPDLYDSFEENRHSHASPFARIMEAGLVQELVQIGIRTINEAQRTQAEKFGVHVIEMKDWRPLEKVTLGYPVYISLDMDGLDPSYAPGVSHQEAGGLSTREVISIIQTLDQPLIGADLVEFNPERDPTGITGAAAAKLFKEILGRMLTGRRF